MTETLWRGRNRWATLGIVAVITVVATEAMAVSTIMPTVVRSLHGIRFYGWAFTAYLLADVVGMIDAGSRCDRHGPGQSLIGGLLMFIAGLVVAAAAPNMPVFLLGRVLQGLGGGSQIVAVYVLVARGLPDHLHQRAFGVTSGAWVVPSLVAPSLAGLVTNAVGWRWVFAGIIPIALAGVAVLRPSVASLPEVEHTAEAARIGRTGALLLAAGLGLLQIAGQHWGLLAIPIAIAGVVIAARPLRLTMPEGTTRVARGLPTVVILRGAQSAAFAGAEAYLPLALARLHHASPGMIGIPLTIGALGWSAGSAYQTRSAFSRPALVRAGFSVVALGLAGLAIVALPGVSPWVAAPAWAVVGTGMGLAMPAFSVLMLALSPAAEHGRNAAALQVSDMTGSILAVGYGATLVSAFGLGHLRLAVTALDFGLAGLALAGAVIATRVTVAAPTSMDEPSVRLPQPSSTEALSSAR